MTGAIGRRRLLGAALVSAWWLQAQAQAQAQPGPDAIDFAGALRQTTRLDRKALAALPAELQGSGSVVRKFDGVERTTTVRGVRLGALLESLGLDERDRYDWRKSVVIAIATDGYRAVYSWPELVNTDAGKQVLLVIERDGAPLDGREGPVALHALGDLRSGPRHVRNLMRIEVRILRD